MDSLVECVPNVSEGDDGDTLDAVAAAIEDHAGHLAARPHRRPRPRASVFTLAGYPGRVMGAMEAAVEVAIERIDMRRHAAATRASAPSTSSPSCPSATPPWSSASPARASSPRASPTASSCRSTSTPGRPAARARSPGRRPPPGFEGLAAGHGRARRCSRTSGPPVRIPRAGATVVGARPFLIAFNIQLSTTDVAVARRIAARIRERDGGLPAVQALGIDLASQGCAQLSMNILDHERTPLWRVWEEAERLAAAERVSLLDSELIGLARPRPWWRWPTTSAQARSTPRSSDCTKPPPGCASGASTRAWSLEVRLARARGRTA